VRAWSALKSLAAWLYTPVFVLRHFKLVLVQLSKLRGALAPCVQCGCAVFVESSKVKLFAVEGTQQKLACCKWCQPEFNLRHDVRKPRAPRGL
jgi:hypothetical protein